MPVLASSLESAEQGETPREEGARRLCSPGHPGSLCGRDMRTRWDKELEASSEPVEQATGLAVGGWRPAASGCLWVPPAILLTDAGPSRRQDCTLVFYKPTRSSLPIIPGVVDVLVLLAGLDPLPGVPGLPPPPISLAVSSWSAARPPFLYPSLLCATLFSISYIGGFGSQCRSVLMGCFTSGFPSKISCFPRAG